MASPQSAGPATTIGEWRAWLGALGGTGLSLVIAFAFIARITPELTFEPWLTMWLELAVLGMAGALLMSWLLPHQSALRSTLGIGAVGLFLTLVVLLTLRTTPYTLDALSGDQGLYTANVTKFAAYDGNVDAIYGDLPAFYPPLYFYLLGRLAAWLQIEPYKMLKLGLLGTTILLPFLLSWGWRRLVSLPLAAATAFTLLADQQWYKPAEWLTMVIFVPWWLHWVENCTERPLEGWIQRLRWWLVGGLIGALIFQGYYYWFFIGGISFLLQLVRSLLSARERHKAWVLLRNGIPMLTSAALFSAIYWLPYLSSMVRSGGWRILQNRWIAQGKLPLPLPFAEDTFAAVILCAGLLYLAWMAPRSRVMRSLLYLLIAVYGWLALGYVGMLTGAPILSFRAYPLTVYIPALGVAFGLAHLWQQRTRIAFGVRALDFSRLIAATGIVVVLFFAQNTVVSWLKNEDVPKAIAMTYPAERLTALDEAVGHAYTDKTILLSRDYVEWVAYRPFFVFLTWSAHYSHPAAHYADRLDLLERLTMVHSPELFAVALQQNRYGQIDHLLLKPTAGGWQMTFLDDNFPNRNVQRTLTFADTNLAPPYFLPTPVAATWDGALTLLTPDDTAIAESATPLFAGSVSDAPLADVALTHALIAGFGRHLADNVTSTSVQRQTEERLLNADLSTVDTVLLADLAQFSAEPLRTKAYDSFVARLTTLWNQSLTDQVGVHKVNVIGATVSPSSAQQPPVLSIYLEMVEPVDWDYSIWLHAFRDGEKSTLDFAPTQPSTTWLPGQIVHLQRPLTLASGSYELQFGFWRSAEDVRLITSSGEVGLSVGTVIVP